MGCLLTFKEGYMEIVLQNLHLIVGAFALLTFAAAKLIEARAKSNPDKTWEDDWSGVVNDISGGVIDAVEKLAQAEGWKGTEKLAKVLKHMSEIEALWKAGKKTEAVATVNALIYDAAKKAEAAIPAPTNPTQPPTK